MPGGCALTFTGLPGNMEMKQPGLTATGAAAAFGLLLRYSPVSGVRKASGKAPCKSDFEGGGKSSGGDDRPCAWG